MMHYRDLLPNFAAALWVENVLVVGALWAAINPKKGRCDEQPPNCKICPLSRPTKTPAHASATPQLMATRVI
jgi:hypothetical protein